MLEKSLLELIKPGDRILYCSWGEKISGIVTEVAVRCGFDVEGHFISDEDYVIVDNDIEVGYNDILAILK